MTGTLLITIVCKSTVKLPDEEVWPGCITLEDVVKLQQKFIDEGFCDILDFVGENSTIVVTREP